MAGFIGVPGWPPKTCPRPFSNVAPRWDVCPLTRGNSNPGGPMSLTVGGRGHVEGGKTISRSAPSAFNLPPKPARSATGGWVREVEDLPDFLVR